MLLLQLIKESICLDHTHIHTMPCGFLLKNSQGEWVSDRWGGGEVGHHSWKNLRRGAAARAPSPAPLRCCPPDPSIFARHPSASLLPTSHPSRRTCVASVATRGLSERLVHKCQSRFCFPALHYSADTVPHFVSTVKPLRGNFSPSTCQIADGSAHGCDQHVDIRCPSLHN